MKNSTKVILGLVLVFALAALGFTALRAPASKASNIPAVTESDWQIKAEGSNVTLLEYADFQCPACGAYNPIIKALHEEYKGRVNFVFRHFPLPMHVNAVPAAIAAEAAGKQGKFFEMANELYDHQNDWSESKTPNDFFVLYAESIGLDTAMFKTDLESQALKDKVVAANKAALAAGMNSTPSFVLNGTKIDTPTGSNQTEALAGFRKILDAELSKNANAQSSTTAQ